MHRKFTNLEIYEMMSFVLKIKLLVLESCIVFPFTRHLIPRLCGSKKHLHVSKAMRDEVRRRFMKEREGEL